LNKTEYFKELEYRLRGLPERERQNILAVYEELFQKAEANGKSESDIIDSLGFPRVPNWEAARGTAPEPPAAEGAAAPGHGGAGDLGTPSGRARPDSGAGPRTADTAVPPRRAGVAAAGTPPADPLRDPSGGFVPPASHPPAPPYGERPFPAGTPDGSRGFVPPEPPPYRDPGPIPPPFRYPGFAPPPPYREPIGSGAKPWIAALALAFFNLVFILGPFIGLCGAIIGLWVADVALLLSPLYALFGSFEAHDEPTRLLIRFACLGGFGAGLMLAVVLRLCTKWFCILTYKYMKFNWFIIKGA
jgi:uncharacterized membrane protein